MKKLFTFIIGLIAVLTLTACSEDTYEVAMITNGGTVNDGSFNQSTWLGIEEYCEDNDITYKYYIPSEKTDTSFLESISLAVENGAELIIAPGEEFETTIYIAQFKYPAIDFMLLDGIPHTPEDSVFETSDNTLNILFNEQEAGFLAGYAVVKDGYHNLGFIGGVAEEFVTEYGVGFIAGSFYAASELEVELVFNDATYYHVNEVDSTVTHRNVAANMFVKGTELIFTAGTFNNNVIIAAEEFDGKVVTSNDDKTGLSSAIVSSVVKDFKSVVVEQLKKWDNGNFVGGKTITKGVTTNGVYLNIVDSQFSEFNQADYDEIYLRITNGTINVPMQYEELASFFADIGIKVEGYPSKEVVQYQDKNGDE